MEWTERDKTEIDSKLMSFKVSKGEEEYYFNHQMPQKLAWMITEGPPLPGDAHTKLKTLLEKMIDLMKESFINGWQ